MTEGPLCPKHHSPMKMNSRGWFCPRKDESTPKGYCVHQQAVVTAVPASMQAPTQAAAPAAYAPQSSSTVLKIAAFDFAARVYQGCAQGDDALMLAINVYREMSK